MKTGVILDRVFERHLTSPGHPEHPERIGALLAAFDDSVFSESISRYDPVPLDPEWILNVHSPEHLEKLRETAGRASAALDPDTVTGPESFEVARLMAGSGIRLLELVGEGEIEVGFLLGRPPGHHAESDRSMGFCLLNNVAIAAQWALHKGLAAKVAIVDFDVHHGNGTQEIFYSRGDVLYISSHQWPFYPGTGTLEEVGTGPGTGCTVNFPLAAGKDDSFYVALYHDLVNPILLEFAPELVLVSAGFDAHRADPLGGMLLSEDGFGRITGLLNGVAAETAGRGILYFLEGGYDLDGLAKSVTTCVRESISPRRYQVEAARDADYSSYRRLVSDSLSSYWRCLSE